MGIYNSQYESYYSKFSGSRKGYNPYNPSFHKSNSGDNSILSGGYWAKRLLRELIGVFVMLIVVLICKAVATPQTTAVYNYSKSVVNNSYDYTYLLNKVKSLGIYDINDFNEKLQDYIEKMKVKISGGYTIKEKVKKDFIAPIKGEVAIDDGKNGIEITAAEGSAVSTVYDGSVKEAGESKELGKYVIIDHGSGIESRYCFLSEVSVKKGNEIKKGEVIGKSGNSQKYVEPTVHLDLYYMGESVCPTEYINF